MVEREILPPIDDRPLNRRDVQQQLDKSNLDEVVVWYRFWELSTTSRVWLAIDCNLGYIPRTDQ